MSIAGEISRAIERGESIGCTAIQIFTKSNRQWYAKPIEEKDAQAFKQAWKNSSIKSIVAHASYLLNIGSPSPDAAKKSLEALKIEFQRCAQLAIPYLVIHPGSYTSSDETSCIERIGHNLDVLFEHVPHGTILLETMAGQGSQVGYTFEQLAQIIKFSKHKKRIGICFDTCHAFAAGYDFRTENSYNLMWEHFDKTIGINKLKAIHLNDSHKDLGSRVDRHADRPRRHPRGPRRRGIVGVARRDNHPAHRIGRCRHARSPARARRRRGRARPTPVGRDRRSCLV